MTMPAAGAGPAPRREPLDPDNYHDGFAKWSGTSFAAPELAARIAAQMTVSNAADPANLGLDEPGPEAGLRRTVAALETLGWEPGAGQDGDGDGADDQDGAEGP